MVLAKVLVLNCGVYLSKLARLLPLPYYTEYGADNRNNTEYGARYHSMLSTGPGPHLFYQELCFVRGSTAEMTFVFGYIRYITLVLEPCVKMGSMYLYITEVVTAGSCML